MSIAKAAFLNHLQTLARAYRPRLPPPFSAVRCMSFATQEEAAAERRKRKRRLRMEPPLNSFNRSHQQQQQPQISRPIQNPNIPKLPESVSSLTGKRLDLHNHILKLIRENDLEEAALFTRHSVYSNCRPTIFTVNAVLAAQLRQGKYAALLQLHRFINQAGIAANIVTYNLIFQAYLDVRKPEIALEHYKLFIDNAPLNPSIATFRILVKGLVDNDSLEKAMEVKEDMCVKGFVPDPVVYSYLMIGCVKSSDADGVLQLYDELKEKLGGFVEDGVVYGQLLKGYFMKEMEKEAIECYEEAVGENSKVQMSAMAYNYVFRQIGAFRCSPDTLSFNNLMNQLCENGLLAEAENLYGEMDEKKVKPDEYTYGLLMDTCFKEGKIDEGAAYYKTMVESSLRPNLAVYNRLQDQLVKAGKLDDAKSFFDMMVSKLSMDDEAYKFIMSALKLRKEGREDDLQKLMDEKERLKTEAKAKELGAAEAKNRSTNFRIASLIPKQEQEKSDNVKMLWDNNGVAEEIDVADVVAQGKEAGEVSQGEEAGVVAQGEESGGSNGQAPPC
ncbi:hypothetical protein HID58_042567 [Brassica napus]|uniref:Pentatricopeptide repeat-containing protein n=1 Tax=Brassica napus TaxID=3708 RepID=A0ABQ8BE16_BRANA|nr:hypothetical protein HID58_042567 [Brassica napus]